MASLVRRATKSKCNSQTSRRLQSVATRRSDLNSSSRNKEWRKASPSATSHNFLFPSNDFGRKVGEWQLFSFHSMNLIPLQLDSLRQLLQQQSIRGIRLANRILQSWKSSEGRVNRSATAASRMQLTNGIEQLILQTFSPGAQ